MTNTNDLVKVCAHQLCEWRPGAVVVRQGARSDALYIVLHGELDAWFERADRTDRIADIRAGELIGAAGLFAPGPAAATVRAVTAARAVRVAYGAVEELWATAPAVARALHDRALRALIGRLREANCEHEARAALRARTEGSSWTSAAA